MLPTCSAILSGLYRILLSLTLCCAAAPAAAASAADPAPAGRDIDLVICLDSSNSMDGLIDSAKQRLWDVVNELARIRPTPNLRVALYHYGNDGLDAETGWVERLSPFTTDLDALYGKLFAIRTNGGTEYVARVASRALENLEWSKKPDAMRVLYVAGNEPATQDRKLDLAKVAARAREKGVLVNTLHCGPAEEGRNTGWAMLPEMTAGVYAAIDAADGRGNGIVAVATVYDEPLSKLGVALNATYLPYGKKEIRIEFSLNQAAQDANSRANAPSAALASNAASRAAAKSSVLYRNGHWDLVDAIREKALTPEKAVSLPADELPDGFAALSVADRRERIEQARAERERIQAEIRELDRMRQAAIRKEMEARNLSDATSLDAQMRLTIRKQAQARGFVFEPIDR